jgi:dTMP kinase
MVYVVLDGPDGGGKSTHAALLTAHLQQGGREVLHLREPGSTPVGEALRALLLDPRTGDLRPLTEALLFTAARAELVERVVAPALRRGAVVVSERCFCSTFVYQGLALDAGLDFDWLWQITRQAHGNTLPSAVFVLDLPVEVAAQRRSLRTADRFEARDAAFLARVRSAYLELAQRMPFVHVVNAATDVDAVQQDLRRRVALLSR